MRNRFDEQLGELNHSMTQMGMLCEQVIDRTFQVLMTTDNGTGMRDRAAREIIEKDSVIDEKEKEIESLCLKLLLQQQPVARDLRQISAALKMITDMERIGDQAADIAETIETGGIVAPTAEIPLDEMAVATIKMVEESIDAYVKKDLEMAQKVIQYDDTVDDLFVKTKNKLIDIMREDKEDSANVMDLLMIAKYYERIGDHATNIAEWVEFSITGEHQGEKKF